MLENTAMFDLAARGAERGTAESGYSTSRGDTVLVFGDTHFSAVYKGSHIDYQKNCIRVMHMILDKARTARESDGGLAAVIFLGDVFGVKERNIRNTPFLATTIMFFQQLNALAGGHVYTVRGNHDFGEFPDFHLFEQLELIKNPDYLDFNTVSGGTGLRFHFMNYGAEDKHLDLHPEGNIVLAHNDFSVPGVTKWYGGDTAINASSMTNLIGVDMLLVGHIHDPFDEIGSFTIGDAGTDEISIYYPGCPTRVSQRYDDCFYCEFTIDQDTATVDLDIREFGLWPASEEFIAEGTVDEPDASELERAANLEEILNMLRTNEVFGGDVRDQIRNIPYARDSVKELALNALDRVA